MHKVFEFRVCEEDPFFDVGADFEFVEGVGFDFAVKVSICEDFFEVGGVNPDG